MTEPKANKPQAQKLTTERLNDIASAFKQVGTLLNGKELKLFSKVAEGPAEIVMKTSILRDSTERLMIPGTILLPIERASDTMRGSAFQVSR